MKLFSFILPYVLMLTFSSGQINTINFHMIKMINQSPYDGVAVQVVGPYDPKTFSYQNYASAISMIRQQCKKQIWPWVFFNRFVGYKPGGKPCTANGNVPYFNNIKGMDIYNTAGALGDFFQIWRLSLKMAREMGTPGIFVDPEAYNNYQSYSITFLANEMGRTREEIEKQLKFVGRQLVDIADEEYPEATLWFYMTGLTESKSSQERSITVLIRGMLERIKNTNSKLILVSGGGISLGNCHNSLADLQNAIKNRNKASKELLAANQNLRLGGTITPWDDAKLKKDWYAQGKCGASPFTSLAEFKPLITELIHSYKYVWIYAAGGVGYFPFNPEIARRYNPAIGEAIAAGKKK